ncbi:MAG: hypothetical protein ABSF09_12550 [Candidatus Bathyarchaeia archaeon]
MISSKLLQGTSKDMRHIQICNSDDIRPAEFTRLLKRAAKIATAK